ncbi:hypothetical protein CEB3_c50470 [Peptococcaceae bacterium CEB3]|nr:hypothetical protein CEB3_c50470 [Peptococcaceae bacterium CEB3]
MSPLAFQELVQDILDHPEFKQLTAFPHHKPFTVYDHSLHVAWLTYTCSVRLRQVLPSLDSRSATRGALLHDFFLYDWHLPRPDGKHWHGLRHPRTAYQNADRCFCLSTKEQDIILSHMWPLTPRWPRSLEAFLVCITDKVATVGELWLKLRGRSEIRLWDNEIFPHVG